MAWCGIPFGDGDPFDGHTSGPSEPVDQVKRMRVEPPIPDAEQHLVDGLREDDVEYRCRRVRISDRSAVDPQARGTT